MNHVTISRVAILILAAVMIFFGIEHFRKPDIMANYVPGFLPGGIVWVYLVGIAFILTALSFILNRYVAVAGYFLALLLILFVVLIHIPNSRNSADVLMRENALVNALKDTAIAAFAIYISSTAKHQQLSNQ